MHGNQPFDFNGASLLVTGGTGSFGRAFIKMVLEHYKPKRLIVFSRDELKQFEMEQDISHPCLRYFIGDVRDEQRLMRALDGVDTVVHAAALKQVPAAEYNPIECIRTNVLGAENVINASITAGVKRVIALSTDKAVNPMNLYGATKLCSDKLFVAANNLSGSNGTIFSVVRYGNVIGSRGSVIPFFKNLVSTGKLPITDSRMTRFWLTVEEGVSFVDICLNLMRGGEIFIPKIPSMKIVDLAKAIGPDCELETIGIRPGEKLHEIMVPGDEALNTLEYDKYYIIHPAFQTWAAENTTYEGSEGRPVAENFEYASNSNTDWIDAEKLCKIID